MTTRDFERLETVCTLKVSLSKVVERSQNTVLLASTQAVYKAPHSTVREHSEHSVVRS